MEDFYEQLEEALEAEEPLAADTVLADLEEWDSLGTLAVVSMISERYGVSLASEQLAGAATAGDLLRLVEGQLAESKS